MVLRRRKTTSVSHDQRSLPDGQSETESELSTNVQPSSSGSIWKLGFGGRGSSSSHAQSHLMSRVEEKECLQDLNSRLAAYIDFIQRHGLGPDASEYFEGIAESVKSKMDDLQRLYEAELADVRRNLDSTSYRFSESQVQLKKANSIKDEAVNEMNRVKSRESQLADQLVAIKSTLARAENELERMRHLPKDYDDLVKQHDMVKDQLESETLLRTDLKNRLITLSEQLAFKDRLLEEQKDAWNSEAVRAELERLAASADAYRVNFHEKLGQLRLEMAAKMNDALVQVKQQFETTLSADRARTDKDGAALASVQAGHKQVTEKLHVELKDKSRELIAKVAELRAAQSDIARLEQAMKELGSEMQGLRSRQSEELKRLFEALDDKTKQCADLACIKVQLDAEIAMYRKLLESEESRCSLSPDKKLTGKPIVNTSRLQSATSSSRQTSTTFGKRKMTSPPSSVPIDLDSSSESESDNQSSTSSRATSSSQQHLSKKSQLLPTLTRANSSRSSTSVSYRRHELSSSSSALDAAAKDQSALRITCSSDGPIHFSNADPGNGLIRIYNADDKLASLGGWRLHFGPTKSGLTDHVILHSFPKRFSLQPHSELKVYITTVRADDEPTGKSAKRPKYQSDPGAMHLVTDYVIWPSYNSVIALQGSDGKIQALCEIDPINSKQAFQSIGKQLLTTIDEVLSNDESDNEDEDNRRSSHSATRRRPPLSPSTTRTGQTYLPRFLLGRRTTLLTPDSPDSQSKVNGFQTFNNRRMTHHQSNESPTTSQLPILKMPKLVPVTGQKAITSFFASPKTGSKRSIDSSLDDSLSTANGNDKNLTSTIVQSDSSTEPSAVKRSTPASAIASSPPGNNSSQTCIINSFNSTDHDHNDKENELKRCVVNKTLAELKRKLATRSSRAALDLVQSMYPEWTGVLANQLGSESFDRLANFVAQERKSKTVYPPFDQIFSWSHLSPPSRIRVVILGQDPYHGPNQAHGLAFSVKRPIPPPPSLVNMFKEISKSGLVTGDIKWPPGHGDLTGWASQGVLLLNAVLTVVASTPNSHKDKGWEPITDAVVRHLNKEKSNLVFMLWGAFAQKQGSGIDKKRHLVLQAPHPSPLSASRGFFGCQHFVKANEYLEQHGLAPINWTQL